MSPRVLIVALLWIGASPIASAQNIRLLPTCIEPFSDGTGFIANFGYESFEPALVQVLIGPDNRFTPGQEDRNQPVVFLPGYFERAFRVRQLALATDPPIIWSLLGNTISASTSTRRCESTEPNPQLLGRIDIVSGGRQSIRVGTLFPQPVVVRATFAGRPIANAVLRFVAPTSAPQERCSRSMASLRPTPTVASASS